MCFFFSVLLFLVATWRQSVFFNWNYRANIKTWNEQKLFGSWRGCLLFNPSSLHQSLKDPLKPFSGSLKVPCVWISFKKKKKNSDKKSKFNVVSFNVLYFMRFMFSCRSLLLFGKEHFLYLIFAIFQSLTGDPYSLPKCKNYHWK